MIRRAENGQATVELALCLPLVALLAGALVEAGTLAADRGRLVHAAREAARVAVVDPDPEAAIEAAEAGGLENLEVAVTPGPESRVQGDPLRVLVTYDPPARWPVLAPLLRGVRLEAQAVMRIERP